VIDLRVPAYAKVNLCLFLGRVREDGRHDLVTVYEAVDLADELWITESSSGGEDEVVCPGVEGPNLVGAALGGLRAGGWSAPPLRVEIEKRIPVGGGMAGGSADAAALLRHASELAPVGPEAVRALAAQLGSDVPSQLAPGPVLGLGAGDIVSPLLDLEEHALLVLPGQGLATADVYRQADESVRPRTRTELLSVQVALELAAAELGWRPPSSLVVNELQAATLALRPEVARALAAARGAGADRAIVCGSGPTVIGFFWGAGALGRAEVAVEGVRERFPSVRAVSPVRRGEAGPAAKG
jgi:4-diphosphocytidyl-2-C-methyl-D-erythritol kinase